MSILSLFQQTSVLHKNVAEGKAICTVVAGTSTVCRSASKYHAGTHRSFDPLILIPLLILPSLLPSLLLLSIALILILVLYLAPQHIITRIHSAHLRLLFRHILLPNILLPPPYPNNPSPLLSPRVLSIARYNLEPEDLTRSPAMVDVEYGVALCFGCLCSDPDLVVHVARHVALEHLGVVGVGDGVVPGCGFRGNFEGEWCHSFLVFSSRAQVGWREASLLWQVVVGVRCAVGWTGCFDRRYNGCGGGRKVQADGLGIKKKGLLPGRCPRDISSGGDLRQIHVLRRVHS